MASDRWYDVSAGGQNVLMLKPPDNSDASAIVVIQGWDRELNARVPVK